MSTNPFTFSKVSENSLFINREQEKREIKNYILNGQNVVVIGPRKIGKTLLLTKIEGELRNEGYRAVWIDISSASDVKGLASIAIKEVINRIWGTKSIVDKIKSIPAIMPYIEISFHAGFLDINIKGNKQDATEVLLNTLKYVSTLEKVFVIFDEFQDVEPFDLTGQIRYIAQHNKNSFIFMGSNQSMMRDIFLNKKRIMYNIGAIVPIGRLTDENIKKLIRKGFAMAGLEATENAVNKITDIVNGFPYFAQSMGFEIVSNAHFGNLITKDTVENTLTLILNKNSYMYEKMLSNKRLKAYRKVLKYIADNKTSAGIFQKSFEENSNAIRYTLQRMEEDEILIKEGKTYIIGDPFFAEYIRRKLE